MSFILPTSTLALNVAPTSSPNEHIREYLDYYISFKHAPHYAVLLNGPWGIGKTYLIREILKSHFEGTNRNYIYVSLYGLSSYEELDRALMNAIYPILDNKAAIIGGKVAKAAMSFFKVDPKLDAQDFVSKFKDALYVFDDLERCILPIQKVMGYINEFVEHDSCKVVIIANEDAIKDKLEYFDRREKTVGKILKVQSSIQEAMTYFLSKVEDSETKTFFETNAEHISAVFMQSRLDNLRILQQTFWDFERIYKAIAASRKTNAEAMKVLLDLFFALSFEVKAGKLKQDDITSRQNAQLFSFLKKEKDDSPPTAFENAIKCYADIDLTDTLLSDDVLIDLLFKGMIRPDAIEASLEASNHFQDPSTEIPWRIVWHFMEHSDNAVQTALTKMESQFTNHEFVIPGEILHVFGLRLWASERSLIKSNRKKVFEENKAYLGYIYDYGLLNALQPESLIERLSGYGGLKIYERDSTDFIELYTYFAEKRTEAIKNQYPTWGAELLADMQHDHEGFFTKTTLQQGASNKFYQIPVLASIDPAQFVKTLLALTPLRQKYIVTSLGVRYEYGDLKDRLKDEAPWLQAIHDELVASLADASPLVKARFDKLLNWHIYKHVVKPEHDVATLL